MSSAGSSNSVRQNLVSCAVSPRMKKGFQPVASSNNTDSPFQRAHRLVSHETVEPSIALKTWWCSGFVSRPGLAAFSSKLTSDNYMQKPTSHSNCPKAIHNSNVSHCAHSLPNPLSLRRSHPADFRSRQNLVLPVTLNGIQKCKRIPFAVLLLHLFLLQSVFLKDRMHVPGTTDVVEVLAPSVWNSHIRRLLDEGHEVVTSLS